MRIIVKLPPRRRRQRAAAGEKPGRNIPGRKDTRLARSSRPASARGRAIDAKSPDVLALPLAAALALADRKTRGLINLPLGTLAIVVVSSLHDAPLATHHRDQLWETFGLPIFEQLSGWDGTVIARECEVHDGLHFEAGTVTVSPDGDGLLVMGRPTVLSAEIVQEHCDCGKETPRLRHLRLCQVNTAKARVVVADEISAAPPQIELKLCVGWMIGVAALLIGGDFLRRGK